MTSRLRLTKQKKVLELFFEKMTGFFTAEELYNTTKKTDQNIGIATVYRFLNNLKEQGRLFTYTCDRRIVYSKSKNSHCHYTCEKTNEVIHFELNNLDFLKEIRKNIPGTITSFQLEIKGTCDECCSSQKKNRKSKSLREP